MKKPLRLDIPLFVSDMSFGGTFRGRWYAARGQGNNSNYFYELASAQFGFSWDKLNKVQAFHFKGGQGA